MACVVSACVSEAGAQTRSPVESCSALPPVAKVSGVSIYQDPAHSGLASPELEKANEQALGGIKTFMGCIEAVLDRRSSPAELSTSYDALGKWAAAGALLEPPTDSAGRVTRVFMAAGFGIIILKFRAHEVATTPQVANWYSKLSAAVRLDYQNFDTNVYAWAGAANALSALVHADNDAYAFQNDVWRKELGRIDQEGMLAPEIARKQRALVYHQLAASGLIILHRARQSLGIPDDAVTSAEMKRLLDQIGHSLCDPSHLASVAGVQQEMPGNWGFRIARGFHDSLMPADWLRCAGGPADYSTVDYGGDSESARAAIEAAARH